MVWKLPPTQKKKIVETKDKEEVKRLTTKKSGFLLKKQRNGFFVLEKKLEKWEYLQEEVRCFLDTLGFQDIESGQSSSLGRYQIDVVGGYDGTLLVFECKSTNYPKLKKITQEINDFAGKKVEIEKAIREKFGSKYNEVIFILALENIGITESDKKTASDNGIFLWGSNYLKTGRELFSLIGPLVLHYVLKELGVDPKTIKDEEGGSEYRIPSFRVTIGDKHLYSFFMPAEKLLNLVYVFHLQPGNEDAYQRFIQKKRIVGTKDEPGITAFVNNGGFFKNSVVCSFEKQVNFHSKPTGLLLPTSVEFGILGIPKLYSTVWIVDGQHRIYGYAGANPEVKRSHIGIMAYEDVGRKQQARDFIDINTKQKPIDPSVLWNLFSQTEPGRIEGAIPKIARELNKEGIFRGKILIPDEMLHSKKSLYPLNVANVCNSIFDRRIFDFNNRDNLYKKTADVTDNIRYPDSTIGHPVKVINQYFSLIYKIAEKTPDWINGFIITNNGFNIFLRVLNEVLKFQKGIWDKQNAEKLLTVPLVSYFQEQSEKIKSIRISTSNEAGRANVALEIIKYIHSKDISFASDFIESTEKRERSAFEKMEPYQTLKELEGTLRIFIEEKLKKITTNWWRERIPQDVQEQAKKNMARNERPWPWLKSEEKSPIFYINFPDYAKIIQRKDNWNEIFLEIFKDSSMIFSYLKELEYIRNKIAHFKPISIDESTTLRLNATKIIRMIKPEDK